MKTLVLANQKGGVGKSALVVQYGYYLSLQQKKKVLIVDLDHQLNTSRVMERGSIADVSTITSSSLLTSDNNKPGTSDLLLIKGDDYLLKVEKQANEHNRYASNLSKFLSDISDQFDVCIIDTNPNPDIRQLAALVVSDYVLSPIQLNQEAIDGIAGLLNHENIGVRKIQKTLNKDLQVLGILPNLVEPTPFQRENLKAFVAAFSKLLIPMPGGGFCAIKRTTAIPEAQAAGIPIWKIGKTSSREAWARIKPVFEKITSDMGV